MEKNYFQKSNLNIRDKIFALDFLLIFLILLLGVISFLAMYSSEQGKVGYYTQSHIYRFSIFFISSSFEPYIVSIFAKAFATLINISLGFSITLSFSSFRRYLLFKTT